MPAPTTDQLYTLIQEKRAAQQALWTEKGLLDAAKEAGALTFDFVAPASDQDYPKTFRITIATGVITEVNA